jgi:hypothetical protein
VHQDRRHPTSRKGVTLLYLTRPPRAIAGKTWAVADVVAIPLGAACPCDFLMFFFTSGTHKVMVTYCLNSLCVGFLNAAIMMQHSKVKFTAFLATSV